MSNTAWGAIVLVYVIAGLPIMSMQMGDMDKPDFSRKTWMWSGFYVLGAVGFAITWFAR